MSLWASHLHMPSLQTKDSGWGHVRLQVSIGERFLNLLWKSEAAQDLGPHHSEVKKAMGMEGHARWDGRERSQEEIVGMPILKETEKVQKPPEPEDAESENQGNWGKRTVRREGCQYQPCREVKCRLRTSEWGVQVRQTTEKHGNNNGEVRQKRGGGRRKTGMRFERKQNWGVFFKVGDPIMIAGGKKFRWVKVNQKLRLEGT